MVREISAVRNIKFPYDENRFNKILERAGLVKGPDLKVDGVIKRLYAVEPAMVGQPEKVWREELAKSINGHL